MVRRSKIVRNNIGEGRLREIIDWLVELLEADGAEISNLVVANDQGSEIEFVVMNRTYSLLISEKGSVQESERE